MHDVIQVLTREFSHIYDWLIANKLTLNIAKTKLLLFDNRISDPTKLSISLSGTPITPSLHANFLGTIIDCKLTWKNHISFVSNKVARVSGTLNRLKHFLPRNALLILYNSLILPHLNYNLLIWGNTHTSSLSNLHRLQKRALRNIDNVSYLAHTGPIFKELRILNIFDLYNYQLGIFLYCFHHNLLPKVFKTFFALNADFHSYDTRAKNQLHLPVSRTRIKQSQVRFAGVKLWNSLPFNIINSLSLESFKRKLRNHLLDLLP